MTHKNYGRDYQTLLEMSSTLTMEIKGITQLRIEIFKADNNLISNLRKTYLCLSKMVDFNHIILL